MIQLVNKNLCTACGACVERCPKKCISMEEREIGGCFPLINKKECIECHSCERVCPIMNLPNFKENINAYAAWNTDVRQRVTSASGGIAYAIYESAIQQKYACVGASFNPDFTVTHKVVVDSESLINFKNSKYVFSNAYDAFPKVKQLLSVKQNVVFIGLPCQVAAFRNLFPNSDKLLLVDVVCHGSVPVSYLKQHIKFLEHELKEKTEYIYFRDPALGTSTNYFSLYNKRGECFYSKRTSDGDLYNYAFHKMVAYRENCYHCRFARPERLSDITLGDFHGNGNMTEWNNSKENVSLIITHTEKGELWVKRMVEEGLIKVEQRPLKEPINGDRQLREPSVKTQLRFDFEKLMLKNNGDFEKVMKEVIELDEKRWKWIGRKDKIKRIIKHIIRK